jgi:hypothetical protein
MVTKKKRYNANVALSEVIDAQQDPDSNREVGNCVGLTALYSVLALRGGLEVTLMYRVAQKGQSGHVLSRVRAAERYWDVENTSATGFNTTATDASEFDIETLERIMRGSWQKGLNNERERRRMAIGLLCGVPEAYYEEKGFGNEERQRACETYAPHIVWIQKGSDDTWERCTAGMVVMQQGRLRNGYMYHKRKLYHDIICGTYQYFCNSIKDETDLITFLQPRDGYEALIRDCRGIMKWEEKGYWGHADREVKRVFLRNLSLAYEDQANTNTWTTAYKASVDEVRGRIKEGRYAATKRKQEVIDTAIADLTEEEKKQIRFCYGLDGNGGNEEALGREEKEKMLHARKKLAYDRRIVVVMDNLSDAEVDTAFKEMEASNCSYTLTPIDVIDNHRPRWFATGVLRENGIYCIEDLVLKTAAEVLQLHGIGKQRLQQLKTRLADLEYSLKSE